MPPRLRPRLQDYLASACALKGEIKRAASALAEARRLSGDGAYSGIARLKAVRYFRVPKVRAPLRSHLFRRPAQGGDAGGVTAPHNPLTLAQRGSVYPLFEDIARQPVRGLRQPVVIGP
jgi:hypothetical protein